MSRLDNLKALMDEHHQTPDDYDAECEEDVRPYFDEGKEVGEWCCVTINYSSSGAKAFFLPEFETAEQAQRRATEYAQDNTFEELPLEVVNLDNGTRYTPDFDSIPWTKTEKKQA